jgi:predicted nucleic acid-binding protein
VRAYVDSSVVLRVVQRAANALPQWDLIDQLISSVLLRVECVRTIERLRMIDQVAGDQLLEYRVTIAAIAGEAELIAIDESILELAEGEFSAPLKSLDAIHLASAIWWRDYHHVNLAFATHDKTLARAARAAGFEVLGA